MITWLIIIIRKTSTKHDKIHTQNGNYKYILWFRFIQNNWSYRNVCDYFFKHIFAPMKLFRACVIRIRVSMFTFARWITRSWIIFFFDSIEIYFLLWSWFCAEIVNFETTRVKARFSARRRSFSVLHFWSCYMVKKWVCKGVRKKLFHFIWQNQIVCMCSDQI